ncbi:MAG TPA: tRNA-dihydrouridine synthase [Candidatus Enterousia avicola]|uniref:tRNA-dihydrouridine synthase n=1 Tax=Candidatus Enterousia avicola TaxID=2840787 RepID=A0A9D1SN59_9PROT|nr:tRNA-dihydrouridine synthase [Candidatus Enterousia avicola]
MLIDNQIFGAPLAGISDKPFRRIVRMFSPKAPLYTEMISCHSLVEAHKNCLRNFDRYDDEGNIGAQIFGADVSLMGDAAKILQDSGATWIDINMGCPVPKVATRSGAGAYLMRDHKLAEKIMKNVVKSVQIPVSIKTRLGWDDEHRDWADLIHIAEDCGISFAALHGRTRAQLYTGQSKLPRIDDNIKIPMIGNGDIKTIDDVKKVFELGFSGAMLGRAMLGRPWVIGVLTGACKTPSQVGPVVLRHLEYMLEYYGERNAVQMFRKHAAWYSAGMHDSTAFRIKVNQISDAKTLKAEICKFWGCEVDI